MAADARALMNANPELADWEPDTWAFVLGTPAGEARLGIVCKRTYAFGDDGLPRLLPELDQELVTLARSYYEALDAPFVSPFEFDQDTAAFRNATDVVVQGHCHTYGEPRYESLVAIASGDFRREILVTGDRRVEVGPDGQPRFTQPEPFEKLPLRYDRAYGGVDTVALARFSNPTFEELKFARPDWQLDRQTPFHYKRNPTGRGFLIEADEESLAAARVPNLSYPFDPVTPERLAVGAPERWARAPLPAALDWTGPGWFPRIAYLGLAKPAPDGDAPIAEIEAGWAAPDLLAIPPPLQSLDAPPRAEHFQAASPGMSFARIALGQQFELTNLHPEHPVWRVALPREYPAISLELEPGRMTPLEPRLSALVFRPDRSELVTTWCASAPIQRAYGRAQIEAMRVDGEWTAVD